MCMKRERQAADIQRAIDGLTLAAKIALARIASASNTSVELAYIRHGEMFGRKQDGAFCDILSVTV